MTFLNTLNADRAVPDDKVADLVSAIDKCRTPATANEEREQLKLIDEDLARGDITLADVHENEQLVMALDSVERLSQKLRVLRAMISFRERFQQAVALQEQLQAACENVRHSFGETRTLERTICLVLTLSNYFNSHRKGACVYGFRIGAFKVLAESKITKSDDKSCTLMGFIAQCIEEKDELRPLARLPEELNLIHAAETSAFILHLYYTTVQYFSTCKRIHANDATIQIVF